MDPLGMVHSTLWSFFLEYLAFEWFNVHHIVTKMQTKNHGLFISAAPTILISIFQYTLHISRVCLGQQKKKNASFSKHRVFFAMPKEIALAGGGAASENRMSLREGKKHHH